MDASLLNPSRFLKSQEFNGKDHTFTISSVTLEELEDEAGKKKTKGIIGFRETPKLHVINRTNTDCIKAMFGRETDNWIGKRVTFFPAPFFDNFTKENTTAIRVRGSPDLKAPVSVVIKLRKKKPTTMTMVITGNSTASYVPDREDPVEAEMNHLRIQIRALTTPDAMDKAWVGGMGGRVTALPQKERDLMREEFAAHKRNLVAGKSAPVDPPPAAEPEPERVPVHTFAAPPPA